MDVLASHKAQIGASSLYVTRSASQSDGYLIDGEYPTTGKCTVSESVESNNPFNTNGGSFIVGIVGADSGSGAIAYYAMSEVQFSSMIGTLLGNINFLQIDPDEISEELQKALINPAQYISSCLWVPVDIGNIPGTGVGSIPVGWWASGIGGTKINPFSARFGGSKTLAVPKHPQAATRGKFLNISPYSDYTLHFFPFGTFALDSIRLQDQASITCRYLIDICTGNAVLYIVDGSNNVLKIANGKYGVPVPTGQISYDTSGSLGSMGVSAGLSGAAGAVGHAKEFFKGAKQFWENIRSDKFAFENVNVGAAANNILSSATAALAVVDVSGQQGSNISLDVPIVLSGRFLEVADEDTVARGRPLCKVVTINTLSGFIQCAEGDIAIDCLGAEYVQIVSHLIGGFFYE